MASTSETGHAKNAANFESLISFAKGYGKKYNPSQAAIKVIALEVIKKSADTTIDDVKTANQTLTPFVNARDIAYEPISKLTRRIVSAIDSSGASDLIVKDAITLSKKIIGTRAKPKPKAGETVAPADATPAPRTISASQLSFDQRLDNFKELVTLLSKEPLYIPNEIDLKVESLAAYAGKLKARNKEVIDATTPASNARIARNKVLYKDVTGLVDVSLEVKKYVRSVFGPSSPEYKQVTALKFTRPR